MVRTGKAGARTVFVCQECGKESLKWLGRCPACQQWNTFVETAVTDSRADGVACATALEPPRELSTIEAGAADRISFPNAEFSRVLGGGLVPGSLNLVGGDPGIGKSTLLLQAAAVVARKQGRVIYISGEETPEQIKIRADRLDISGENLFLFAETNLDNILGQMDELKPVLAVIDSVQTVCLFELDAAPGSIIQVRECTLRLMRWAKRNAVPVFIIGHVTKDGAIAGPRVMEHIVDAVLYLEGEPFSSYRLLRCVKNRFGSTNEVGIFEMKKEGLVEVTDPSQVFLSRRLSQGIGSVVVPVIEGSRPLLVEIQALTNRTSFGLPRRTANGLDFGRLLMIAAVLSRRIRLSLGSHDIIASVTGGLKVGEPSADLGIALAIASSYRDMEVAPALAVAGEIGLSGELRAVPQLERRVAEAARLGFRSFIAPAAGCKAIGRDMGIEVFPAGTLREALGKGLSGKRKGDDTFTEQ